MGFKSKKEKKMAVENNAASWSGAEKFPEQAHCICL